MGRSRGRAGAPAPPPDSGVYFTHHAIERFRERWAGGLPYAHALRELVVLGQNAVLLRSRTRNGDLQYQVKEAADPIVFVCKRDHPGRGGLVCVTVLPEPETDPAEVDPQA